MKARDVKLLRKKVAGFKEYEVSYSLRISLESFISEKEQQHCICCLRTIIGEAVRQWYSHLDSCLMKLK